MKLSNKGSIQLSMTFLVGLIMGIVLFSFGLVFAYTIIRNTPEIKYSPDFIETCNDRVCVSHGQAELRTTKVSIFGVAINNNIDETKTFKVYVTYSKGILEDGSDAPAQNTDQWTLPDFPELILDNNEEEVVDIPLQVPPGTKTGTYVFNVNVCFNSMVSPNDKCTASYRSLYSPTHQFRINVI